MPFLTCLCFVDSNESDLFNVVPGYLAQKDLEVTWIWPLPSKFVSFSTKTEFLFWVLCFYPQVSLTFLHFLFFFFKFTFCFKHSAYLYLTELKPPWSSEWMILFCLFGVLFWSTFLNLFGNHKFYFLYILGILKLSVGYSGLCCCL